MAKELLSKEVTESWRGLGNITGRRAQKMRHTLLGPTSRGREYPGLKDVIGVVDGTQ